MVVAVLPLRLVEVLAFGLATFSFLAAGTFFAVVVVFVLVVVVFFGAAVFLGLASEVFWRSVNTLLHVASRNYTYLCSSGG